MPGKTTKRKQKASRHRWADVIAQTSFPVSALEVLAEHHATLNNFCVGLDSPEDSPTDASSASIEMDNIADARTNFDLSFHQYCVSLNTLIQHGSVVQQFEYLFHTYAAENERGISRAELFQLLEEHSESISVSSVAKDGKLRTETDTRHFEKLYTWIKKQMMLYDKPRCGFLPEKTALEMLQSHPTALTHLKFKLAPFIKKMKENNTRYQDQAAAAQLTD